MNKELNSVPSDGTEAENSTTADATTSCKPIANTHVMGSFIENVKSKLNSDTRFHFLGKGNNEGIWATREKGEDEPGDFIHLKKDLAKKGYGAFEIYLFAENEQGLEFKVRMYVPSYCEWDTFFEGFAENENDFDTVMRMLGLS